MGPSVYNAQPSYLPFSFLCADMGLELEWLSPDCMYAAAVHGFPWEWWGSMFQKPETQALPLASYVRLGKPFHFPTALIF